VNSIININTNLKRIGINKPAPAYPLDVIGDINLSGNLRINGIATLSNTTSNIPTISNVLNLYSSNVYSTNIINSGNCTISGTTIFNSNIGVYNSIPTYPLDVVGDINLTGNLRINGVPLSTSTSVSTTNIISSNITNSEVIFTPILSNVNWLWSSNIYNKTQMYTGQISTPMGYIDYVQSTNTSNLNISYSTVVNGASGTIVNLISDNHSNSAGLSSTSINSGI
jgi:hypothetical protein